MCDYFIENVAGFRAEAFATGKEIWDVSAFAVLMNASWSTSEITATPIITDQLTWSFDYRPDAEHPHPGPGGYYGGSVPKAEVIVEAG